MDRQLMVKLIDWKNSPRRKPLVLNGARQVGKTWLLKEFGKQHFANVAYVSLDNSPGFRAQLDAGYDIDRLLLMIQAESGQPTIAGKTLIILDEIQECPKALTALKYFCENAPEQTIAAAGSLLGITFHEGTGYPVGKVTTLNLHPLNFHEFLDATGNGALHEILNAGDKVLASPFSFKLEELLKQYYFVGGMPEAVATYVDNGSLDDVRQVQNDILFGYERDISKHLGGVATEHTIAAWHSIPAHLGQENKRFVFGHIREGARARDYRSAITWLTQAGIATQVSRVTKPGMPLASYAEESAFKLFMIDVGLLGAMTGLDASSIVNDSKIFTEFKGAMTEQYVCQQLVSACALTPYYWSAENSSGEIDFLVQARSKIYPIEVKAEENLRAKSLRAFCKKYPGMHARRFSLSGFRDQEWMRNVPLYAIGSSEMWA